MYNQHIAKYIAKYNHMTHWRDAGLHQTIAVEMHGVFYEVVPQTFLIWEISLGLIPKRNSSEVTQIV